MLEYEFLTSLFGFGFGRDGDVVRIRVREDGEELVIEDNHEVDPMVGTEGPVNPEDHS